MNSVWQSLLWKEWREHRWILAGLVALSVLLPGMFLLWRPEIVFTATTSMLFLIVPLASMFLAMSIAAREQSTGAVRFLQALPHSTAKAATVKLCIAVLTIIAPVGLAISIASLKPWMLSGPPVAHIDHFEFELWNRAWGVENGHLSALIAMSLAGISLLLWTAAAGVNRSDEVRAGAIGFLVIVSCWGLIALGVYLSELGWVHVPDWFALVFPAAPAGPAFVRHGVPQVLPEFLSGDLYRYGPYALAALASHGALAWWYIRRFGRVVLGRRQEVELPAATVDRAWLRSPRRRPWTAIVWKQARESVPLASMSAACILAIGLFVAWFQWGELDRVSVRDLMTAMFAAWAMIGFLVAAVAGVGLFMDDLQPGLHNFWRSRPINVDHWFWLKFLCGLIVTLGMLAATPLLLTVLAWMIYDPSHKLIAEFYRELPSLLATGVLMQIGAFCTAVAAMTLLRQAIYAAILSLAVVVATSVFLGTLEPPKPDMPTIASIALPFCALAALLAWQTVRRDWGWKH